MFAPSAIFALERQLTPSALKRSALHEQYAVAEQRQNGGHSRQRGNKSGNTLSAIACSACREEEREIMLTEKAAVDSLQSRRERTQQRLQQKGHSSTAAASMHRRKMKEQCSTLLLHFVLMSALRRDGDVRENGLPKTKKDFPLRFSSVQRKCNKGTYSPTHSRKEMRP